jgi:large subunit ribosomal protein L1|tara:strand:+ start:1164 stop:1820 length:657 start_codon:yes stop_codon:yes gene_type:complete
LVSLKEFVKMVKESREKSKKRNFNQSFEIIVTLRDIDVKKQDFNISETVYLAHKFTKKPGICVFAGGDMALKAKRSKADRVIEPEELEKNASDKRQLRKIAKGYSFFLSETTLMPKIGKILGQFLGPKGKMPAPVPPNAPVENMVERFISAVRIRSRGQLAVTGKVGDESMNDEAVAENAVIILNAIEKKLPSGNNNIDKVMLKLTMAEPVTIPAMSK